MIYIIICTYISRSSEKSNFESCMWIDGTIFVLFLSISQVFFFVFIREIWE